MKLSMFSILSVAIILLCATCFNSCSKSGVDATSTVFDRSYTVHNVTSSDINNYLCGIKGLTPTRAAEVSIDPVINGRDTVMFLVNYEDGWEVLSGDLRASRVLVSGEHGNITLDDLSSNPSMAAFMRKLSSGMSDIMHNDSFVLPEDFQDSWGNRGDPSHGGPVYTLVSVITRDTVAYEIKERDHLLETKWGEAYPWNQVTPFTDYTRTQRCNVGCVPVASAQVLYYLNDQWGVPATAYENGYCNAYVIDSLIITPNHVVLWNASSSAWSQMPLNNSYSSGTDLVSNLMLDLGVKYSSVYYSNGDAKAHVQDAVTVFPQYGISCQLCNLQQSSSPTTDMRNIFDDQIYDESIPVIMSILDPNQNDEHTLVVDGYKRRHIDIYTTIEYYTTGPLGIILPGQLPDRVDHFHDYENTTSVAINWGWDGTGDSVNGATIWYNLFSSWVVAHGGSHNYSSPCYLIYGFEPVE